MTIEPLCPTPLDSSRNHHHPLDLPSAGQERTDLHNLKPEELIETLTPLTRIVRFFVMKYQDIITIEPDKRGGKPCVRGMRITVYDVLEYLASGMTEEQILQDFPELTKTDIRACLEFAADGERKLVSIPPQ